MLVRFDGLFNILLVLVLTAVVLKVSFGLLGFG